MREDQLRSLLSSLSHLSEHGDIPVHAFSTLIRSARVDHITEHLHQKWLADSNFGKIAAQIILHLRSIDDHNISFASACLALALRDYKCRYELRIKSRSMFQNYVRTINHLYPTFRRIDKCMGNAILDPLFDCLDILTDEDAVDSEVRCMAQIMIESGKSLNEVRPVPVENLIMKLRQLICAKDIPLSEETNLFLLNVIDLYTYEWEMRAMPESLKRFYEEQIPSELRQFEYNQRPRKRTTSLLGVPGSSGSTTSDDRSPSSVTHSRTVTPNSDISINKRGSNSETESIV